MGRWTIALLSAACLAMGAVATVTLIAVGLGSDGGVVMAGTVPLAALLLADAVRHPY